MIGTTVRARLIAVSFLVLTALFVTAVTAWYGLHKISDANTRAFRIEQANTGLQMLLRGLNEVAATEGTSSSSVETVHKAMEAIESLRDALGFGSTDDAAAGRGLDAVEQWDALKAQTTNFLGNIDRLSLANVEAMISLGRIIGAADNLSVLLAGEAGVTRQNADRVAWWAGLAMFIAPVLALAFVATLLFLFYRSLLAQLGGEPAYAAGIANRIAGGDLMVRVHAAGNDKTSLLASMKNMSDKLVAIVTEVRAASDAVGLAAGTISAGNADLSMRTQEQASALEQTASSMEEITSTVKQNANNAQKANQLAAEARELAEGGAEAVTHAIDAMNAISASSGKIADIVGVIDEIAFQTNLLALNASVEAARAGQQGRGFAVVANEVRNLAQRSAQAAREIKELIGDSVGKVSTGSEMVSRSGETLSEIVAAVKKVSDIIAEIAAASQEQASGVDQVNSAVMQMDQMTQQNAALVEEAAAAAKSMEDQARTLIELMSFFGTDAHTPADTTGQGEPTDVRHGHARGGIARAAHATGREVAQDRLTRQDIRQTARG